MAGAESAQCAPGWPIPSWQGGRLNHSRTETLCPSQFTRTVFRASMSSFRPQSCPELSGLSASSGAWRRRRAPAPRMVWTDVTSGRRCHGYLERPVSVHRGGEGAKPARGGPANSSCISVVGWRRQPLRSLGHGGFREWYGPENLGIGQQHAGSAEYR